jgi:hypothetical protein
MNGRDYIVLIVLFGTIAGLMGYAGIVLFLGDAP